MLKFLVRRGLLENLPQNGGGTSGELYLATDTGDLFFSNDEAGQPKPLRQVRGGKTFVRVSANYQIKLIDDVILSDNSNALTSVILTLPDNPTIGKEYTIKRITRSSGNINTIVQPSLGKTIDGLTSVSLTTNNQSIHIVADETGNWLIISAYNGKMM